MEKVHKLQLIDFLDMTNTSCATQIPYQQDNIMESGYKKQILQAIARDIICSVSHFTSKNIVSSVVVDSEVIPTKDRA